MKAKRIILIALVLLFAGAAFYSMRGMMTPYVPFKEAMSSGEYVQVIGARDRALPVEHAEGSFAFTMRDRDGTVMRVMHRGAKPQNFEHAEQVVALGSFDKSKKLFEAERILVKCPSKYEKEKKK